MQQMSRILVAHKRGLLSRREAALLARRRYRHRSFRLRCPSQYRNQCRNRHRLRRTGNLTWRTTATCRRWACLRLRLCYLGMGMGRGMGGMGGMGGKGGMGGMGGMGGGGMGGGGMGSCMGGMGGGGGSRVIGGVMFPGMQAVVSKLVSRVMHSVSPRPHLKVFLRM